MSGCSTRCFGRWELAPPVLPAMHVGEIDGRYIDMTSDLGAVGDQIVDLSTVSIAIARIDGFPLTASDLALSDEWPMSLDDSHLVLTIGLSAPTAGSYRLTLTVNKTLQGRLFIADMTIDILAVMG